MKLWSLLAFILLTGFASSVESSICYQKTIQRELYRSLFKAIKDNVICEDQESSAANVELLGTGITLSYDDYNPGFPSKFDIPGSLPLYVVENGLPIIDQIYPTGSTRFRQLSNSSSKLEDSRFDTVSSTYDFILTHMVLRPQNFSDLDVLRAKFYLQELVPNPERVLRNETQLPRFLLYDHYRSAYLSMKESMNDAKDQNQAIMIESEYQQWGQKKLSKMESDTEAAYQKWQTFGYKSEVEKQLQYFEVDAHEDLLSSTRALFKSMGRASEKAGHKTIYPFTLKPSNWFEHLKLDLPESSDELQYKKSLLQAKQALLNATRQELSNQSSEDVNEKRRQIQESLSRLSDMIKIGVDKLTQMERECFAAVNLTVCGEIEDGHTAFRYLLEELADHYAQADYLDSLLKQRSEVVKLLNQKLSQVGLDIDSLERQITTTSKRETSQAIDSSTSSETDVTSCPGVGQIKFQFDSENYDIDSYCQNLASQSANCVDVEVPLNVSNQDLWDVHSCSVDSELISFNKYEDFRKLMNSIPVKVTASLLKVKVERSWFDPSIFENADFYTMKHGSEAVSPGSLKPEWYSQQAAHSGDYLLPHYIAAFILASDVKIYFPSIGSLNFSSLNEQTNGVIQILMKYAYAQVLTGSMGPFNFHFGTGFNHNFQVKRQNGGLLLTLPGAQIIGYIMKTIPKFPQNQTEPPMVLIQPCSDVPKHNPAHRRSRRSTTEDANSGEFDIAKLAKSLFSESSNQFDLSSDDSVLSRKYIEDLIDEGENKRKKISKFVSGLGKKKTPAESANFTTEDFDF